MEKNSSEHDVKSDENIEEKNSSTTPVKKTDEKKKKNKKPTSNTEGDKAVRYCKVCDSPSAAGFYFGVLSCIPCKAFFIRCLSELENGVPMSCVSRSQPDQCQITMETRTNCKSCRYQKCLREGMARKERPMCVSNQDGRQLCAVCADIANGVHFGAVTCEGCKKFFRRGLNEAVGYACRYEKNCVLNPRTRNACRYCRWQKCLQVGMSRDAIRMGRPSRFGQLATNKRKKGKDPEISKESETSNPEVIDVDGDGAENEKNDEQGPPRESNPETDKVQSPTTAKFQVQIIPLKPKKVHCCKKAARTLSGEYNVSDMCTKHKVENRDSPKNMGEIKHASENRDSPDGHYSPNNCCNTHIEKEDSSINLEFNSTGKYDQLGSSDPEDMPLNLTKSVSNEKDQFTSKYLIAKMLMVDEDVSDNDCSLSNDDEDVVGAKSTECPIDLIADMKEKAYCKQYSDERTIALDEQPSILKDNKPSHFRIVDSFENIPGSSKIQSDLKDDDDEWNMVTAKENDLTKRLVTKSPLLESTSLAEDGTGDLNSSAQQISVSSLFDIDSCDTKPTLSTIEFKPFNDRRYDHILNSQSEIKSNIIEFNNGEKDNVPNNSHQESIIMSSENSSQNSVDMENVESRSKVEELCAGNASSVSNVVVMNKGDHSSDGVLNDGMWINKLQDMIGNETFTKWKEPNKECNYTESRAPLYSEMIEDKKVSSAPNESLAQLQQQISDPSVSYPQYMSNPFATLQSHQHTSRFSVPHMPQRMSDTLGHLPHVSGTSAPIPQHMSGISAPLPQHMSGQTASMRANMIDPSVPLPQHISSLPGLVQENMINPSVKLSQQHLSGRSVPIQRQMSVPLAPLPYHMNNPSGPMQRQMSGPSLAIDTLASNLQSAKETTPHMTKPDINPVKELINKDKAETLQNNHIDKASLGARSMTHPYGKPLQVKTNDSNLQAVPSPFGKEMLENMDDESPEKNDGAVYIKNMMEKIKASFSPGSHLMKVPFKGGSSHSSTSNNINDEGQQWPRANNRSYPNLDGGASNSNQREQWLPVETASFSKDTFPPWEPPAIDYDYWLQPKLPNPDVFLSESHNEAIQSILSAYRDYIEDMEGTLSYLQAETQRFLKKYGTLVPPLEILRKELALFAQATVSFCCRIPGFSSLSQDDQIILFRVGGNQARILTSAFHWYDKNAKEYTIFYPLKPHPGRMDYQFYLKGKEFCQHVRETMEVDMIEEALFNVVVYFSTDYNGLVNAEQISKVRWQILECFTAYTTAKYGSSNRQIEKLFSIVPMLRRVGLLEHQLSINLSLLKDESYPIPDPCTVKQDFPLPDLVHDAIMPTQSSQNRGGP